LGGGIRGEEREKGKNRSWGEETGGTPGRKGHVVHRERVNSKAITGVEIHHDSDEKVSNFFQAEGKFVMQRKRGGERKKGREDERLFRGVHVSIAAHVSRGIKA